MTKFLTPRKHRQSRFSHVRLYSLVSQFSSDIKLKFFSRPFLLKKLLVYRNRRYRNTIAYNCRTNWTIKTMSYGTFLYLSDTFMKFVMDYYQRNFAITVYIVPISHIATIQIKSKLKIFYIFYKNCTWVEYYDVGSAEVHIFSCFCGTSAVSASLTNIYSLSGIINFRRWSENKDMDL